MKLRNTFLALAIFAGLAAWIYFYEYRGEESRLQSAEEAKKVAVFDTDKADSLTLEKPGAKISLLKSDGSWKLTEPVSARADADEVSGLLSTLSLLEVTRKLGPPAGGLKTYNLETPPLRVTLDPGEGKPEVELSVGDKAPVGSGYYARIGKGADVVTVSSSVKKLLDATADGLRYKNVVGMDSWKVTRFEVDRSGGAVAFSKKGSAWRLDKPVEFPADEGKVSSLLYDLTSARADSVEPEGASAKALGLDAPAATLTVQDEKGKPLVVHFSRPDAKGVVHAQRSDMPDIFDVKKELLDKLGFKVDEYRDARVAPIDRWAISEIKAETPGGKKMVVKDKQANWRWGSKDGPTLDSSKVNSLLDAIEATKAKGYEDNPSAGARAQGGPAPLKLVVKGEKGGPIQVRMGAAKGSNVLFTTTASSSLYEVGKDAADKLVKAADALKAPAPAAASAGKEAS